MYGATAFFVCSLNPPIQSKELTIGLFTIFITMFWLIKVINKYYFKIYFNYTTMRERERQRIHINRIQFRIIIILLKAFNTLLSA